MVEDDLASFATGESDREFTGLGGEGFWAAAIDVLGQHGCVGQLTSPGRWAGFPPYGHEDGHRPVD